MDRDKFEAVHLPNILRKVGADLINRCEYLDGVDDATEHVKWGIMHQTLLLTKGNISHAAELLAYEVTRFRRAMPMTGMEWRRTYLKGKERGKRG